MITNWKSSNLIPIELDCKLLWIILVLVICIIQTFDSKNLREYIYKINLYLNVFRLLSSQNSLLQTHYKSSYYIWYAGSNGIHDVLVSDS